MEDILSKMSPEILILVALNFLLIFILFMMNISNRLNLKRFKAKYNKLMVGAGDINVEQLLETCIDKVNDVAVKNREIENKINNIERNLLQCYQKLGVIRYNAFENVGSDLSFSVAILDKNDNGLVLSGIYSRDSSSTYAKPILGGKSKYSLSVEEIQAIEMAKKSFRDKPYTEK
jgi:hypothetical protein